MSEGRRRDTGWRRAVGEDVEHQAFGEDGERLAGVGVSLEPVQCVVEDRGAVVGEESVGGMADGGLLLGEVAGGDCQADDGKHGDDGQRGAAEGPGIGMPAGEVGRDEIDECDHEEHCGHDREDEAVLVETGVQEHFEQDQQRKSCDGEQRDFGGLQGGGKLRCGGEHGGKQQDFRCRNPPREAEHGGGDQRDPTGERAEKAVLDEERGEEGRDKDGGERRR